MPAAETAAPAAPALPAAPAAVRHTRGRAIAALLGTIALAGSAAAADPATPARPAAHTVAQQGGTPLYGVEVIVFRASGVVAAAEDWDAVPPGRGFGSSATRAGAAAQVVRVLAPSDFRLGTLEATLKTSGAWRPIAHAAWIQSAPNWGARAGIALADVGINVPGLSGMVYLERAPIYLHLGFDVHLSMGATYTIKEMRSVRYNDKQYFDHPAFGIIGVVTPIKHLEAATPP